MQFDSGGDSSSPVDILQGMSLKIMLHLLYVRIHNVCSTLFGILYYSAIIGASPTLIVIECLFVCVHGAFITPYKIVDMWLSWCSREHT